MAREISMADPDTGSENEAEFIIAAQQAAESFCAPQDPFAPDQQMIAAQMLGQPMPHGQG